MRLTKTSRLCVSFISLCLCKNVIAHTPHDVIEALDISPNYAQDKTLFHLNAFPLAPKILMKSIDEGNSWSPLKKDLDNQYSLSSIAVSPSYQLDKTLFLSSYGDGIYKSVNGGLSWVKVNNGLADLNIGLLAIHPNYISRSIVLAMGKKGGLYKTLNAGEKWYRVIDDNILIRAIAFSPDLNQEVVFVGDENGILYASTNNGDTWQQVFQLQNTGAITSIAISPTFVIDKTLFIGTEKGGLFKTLDGGHFFSSVTGPMDKSITSIVLSPDYQTDAKVFISTWHEGVFGSDDGGQTWQKLSQGLTSSSQADMPRFNSAHFKELRISKAFSKDGTLFLAGFAGLFKSIDGARSWREMETLFAGAIEGFALSPGYKDDTTIAIATMQGGAYISNDQGTTWQIVNNSLHQDHLVDIAFSPAFSSDRTLFTISNVSFYKLIDKGSKDKSWERVDLGYQGIRKKIGALLNKLGLPEWLLLSKSENEIPFPKGITASPNFANDKTLFLGARYQGIFKSTDGGIHWFSPWEGNRRVTALVISPDFVSDQTLYAGVTNEGKIYKTEDGGITWIPVYTSPSDADIFLAISPNYKIDRMVFAGTVKGLLKTTDGGKSWQSVDTVDFGKDTMITALTISPNYDKDKTIIVSVQGKGLFKSDDGGVNFFPIGSELLYGNHLLKLIKFSPTYAIDNTLYGATEGELFQSKDGGNNWRFIKRPVRYENTRKDYIHYDGQWELLESNNFSTRSVSQSKIENSKATFNFVGTGINWIGTKSSNQGIAKVFVDENFKGFVDQFSDSREVMVISYSITDLAYGPHALQIEVTNTRNPKSTGSLIEIDALDVLP